MSGYVSASSARTNSDMTVCPAVSWIRRSKRATAAVLDSPERARDAGDSLPPLPPLPVPMPWPQSPPPMPPSWPPPLPPPPSLPLLCPPPPACSACHTLRAIRTAQYIRCGHAAASAVKGPSSAAPSRLQPSLDSICDAHGSRHASGRNFQPLKNSGTGRRRWARGRATIGEGGAAAPLCGQPSCDSICDAHGSRHANGRNGRTPGGGGSRRVDKGCPESEIEGKIEASQGQEGPCGEEEELVRDPVGRKRRGAGSRSVKVEGRGTWVLGSAWTRGVGRRGADKGSMVNPWAAARVAVNGAGRSEGVAVNGAGPSEGMAVNGAGRSEGVAVNGAGPSEGVAVNGAGRSEGVAVNEAGRSEGVAVNGAGQSEGVAVNGAGRSEGVAVNGAGRSEGRVRR
eukprot:64365-Chlamydomonas_euryale.AAC.4